MTFHTSKNWEERIKMFVLKTQNGYAVPIDAFDEIQKKNLKEIKFNGRQITDFDNLTSYYPEVKFKNVCRENEDGTIDLIIDAGVANEIRTGFLPKRFYKAIRIKKEKGLLGPKWNFKNIDIIQVNESEIVQLNGGFNSSLSIDDVGNILEAITKKGVKYFD